MNNNYKYEKLISKLRLGDKKETGNLRTLTEEMLSDKKRITLSSAFRRLQTKAQVFSLEKNAAIRSRLTHTLEVALFGELIAEKVFDLLIDKGSIQEENIKDKNRDSLRRPFVLAVENACLLHDIGNPPFGHLGEFAIREWFVQHGEKIWAVWKKKGFKIDEKVVKTHFLGLIFFDGNAQGFRIITRLQWLNNECGFNLTCTVLASTIKYITASNSKIGFFETERGIITDVWSHLDLVMPDNVSPKRHPLSFIMEAADDIAYLVNDIEDAIEKHIVSVDIFFDKLKEFDKSLDAESRKDEGLDAFIDKDDTHRLAKYRKYPLFRVHLVRYLVEQTAKAFVDNEEKILDGVFNDNLLELDKRSKRARKFLKDFTKEYIYTSHEAINIELSGYKIIQSILDHFLALIELSTGEFQSLDLNQERRSCFNLSKSELEYGKLSLERRLFSLLPNKHLISYYHLCENDPTVEPIYRIHLIVDYLSGMTDSHAVQVFNMLSGISPLTNF